MSCITSHVSFHKCQGCGVLGKEMKICAGCNLAAYCSSECQHRHWASHKTSCTTFKQHKQDNKSREYRLLRSWTKKAMGQLSLFCRRCLKRAKFDNTKDAFKVVVDFDYNFKTFKPVGLAEVISLEEARRLNSGVDFETGQELKEEAIIVLIQYKSYFLAFPVTSTKLECLTEDGRKIDMTSTPDELLADVHFSKLTLKSSVFRQWDPNLAAENKQKSLAYLTGSKDFDDFVIHALHLVSKKPLRRTHAVYLEALQGFQLGQVTKFVHYKVLNLKDADAHLKKICSPDQYQIIAGTKLLERPVLTEQSKMQKGMPGETVTILIRINDEIDVFESDVVVKPKAIMSPTKCDKIARKHWAKVLQLPIYDVESPNLNG